LTGANIATQASASTPATVLSANVGTAGSCGERSARATPSARTAPMA
jgi:hypothetical protein